jgi:soluble lytic murein transglycosylase-like protein
MKRIILFFFMLLPVFCLFSNKQGLPMSEVSAVKINKNELEKLNKKEHNGIMKYSGVTYISCGKDLKKVSLMLAIIRSESNFEEEAISRAGAMGLMQLMPATAFEESIKMGHNIKLEDLVKVPEINIDIGISYFNRIGEALLGVQDDNKRLKLMIASYNAGPNRVKRAFGCKGFSCYARRVNEMTNEEFKNKLLQHLPDETIQYLKSVEKYHTKYKNIFAAV